MSISNFIPRAIASPPARSMPPWKRRRESSASISSPTAPTGHTSARSALPPLPIFLPWTSSRAGTCWPMFPRSSDRSISCLGRLIDEDVGWVHFVIWIRQEGVPTSGDFAGKTCIWCRGCSATIKMGCVRRSWRVPAGESPARVRGSARLVASVAAWKATTTAKRTQRSCGVWE